MPSHPDRVRRNYPVVYTAPRYDEVYFDAIEALESEDNDRREIARELRSLQPTASDFMSASARVDNGKRTKEKPTLDRLDKSMN